MGFTRSLMDSGSRFDFASPLASRLKLVYQARTSLLRTLDATLLSEMAKSHLLFLMLPEKDRLASVQIPNLWANEEKVEIAEMVSKDARQLGKGGLQAQTVKSIRPRPGRSWPWRNKNQVTAPALAGPAKKKSGHGPAPAGPAKKKT